MTNLEMLRRDERNVRGKIRRAKARGDGVTVIRETANLRRRQEARRNAAHA